LSELFRPQQGHQEIGEDQNANHEKKNIRQHCSRAFLFQPVAGKHIGQTYREKNNRGANKRDIKHFVLAS